MKVFVVIWIVVSMVPAACNCERINTPDPYTGQMPMISCTLAHFTESQKVLTKIFDAKEEAESFKRNAPEWISKKMVIVEMEKCSGGSGCETFIPAIEAAPLIATVTPFIIEGSK